MKKLMLFTFSIFFVVTAHAYVLTSTSQMLSSPDKTLGDKDPFPVLDLINLENNDWLRLSDNWGTAGYSDLAIYNKKSTDDQKNVDPFLQSLMDNKTALMKLYNADPDGSPVNPDKPSLDNETYNKLAAVAYALSKNESTFGSDPLYEAKEDAQDWASSICSCMLNPVGLARGGVALTKSLVKAHADLSDISKAMAKAADAYAIPTSRGMTQIKFVPPEITKYFGIKKDDLSDPKKAAIATMGVLFYDMQMLKRLRKGNLVKDYNSKTKKFTDPRQSDDPNAYHLITDKDIYDFLPDFYEGRANQLLYCLGHASEGFEAGNSESKGCKMADPQSSPYVHSLKTTMKNVIFLER